LRRLNLRRGARGLSRINVRGPQRRRMRLCLCLQELPMTAATRRQQVRIGSPARPGELGMPPQARALVLFAHGSGSSRLSPRNRSVAGVLQAQHLATLLFDLLTDDEAADRRLVFDVELLGERLEQALDWAAAQAPLGALPVGLFGASTGAAAARRAAARRPERVGAVVSRGGRPDLAARWLPLVTAPTLLIVGGADPWVLQCDRQALRALGCKKRLEVVPGASHLFEEPGTLDSVAQLAAAWFGAHLAARRPP
jgi:pimeloyl-ACP methyl ester carboxylesterase